MEADGDGIAVQLPSGRERFVEIEPLLFRQVNGDARIVFHEEGGQVAQAFYLGRLPLWSVIWPGSVLATVLACATFAFALVAWVKRRGALLGRVYFSVVAVAGVAFVWFLSFWNLLGKGFRAG